MSATCHWDGRLEVIWNDNDGIQIFYNCTGEVEQNVRLWNCMIIGMCVCAPPRGIKD